MGCNISVVPNTPDTDPIAFSERLRHLLDRQGVGGRGAGAYLANRYKVSQPTAHAWLKGKHMPEPERIREIARDHEASFDELRWGSAAGTSWAVPQIARDLAAAAAGGELVLGQGRFAGERLLLPYFNVKASMGYGSEVAEHIEVVREIAVNVPDLRQQCTFTAPQNLAFISAIGTSMEPTFSDGDVLLIDQGIHDIKYDAVYVLERGSELFIKRIQRKADGTWLMISDNKLYEPQPVGRGDMDNFRVRGRVVLAWNAKKL